MSVIDLDGLRTEWHERAVVALAKERGDDPVKALEQSRALRAWAADGGHDLRAPIRKARAKCERGWRG